MLARNTRALRREHDGIEHTIQCLQYPKLYNRPVDCKRHLAMNRVGEMKENSCMHCAMYLLLIASLFEAFMVWTSMILLHWLETDR